MGASGTSNTAGLVFGGYASTFTNVTEGYDGTTWSTRPSIATSRSRVTNGPIGTQTLTLVAGGHASPTVLANTEEFTGETGTVTSQTLTTS